MTERHRESIGRIRRFGCVGELKAPSDHRLDLGLLGAAVAGHGQLDRRRGVLHNRDTGPSGGEKNDPGGATDVDCGVKVPIGEDPLDSHHFGLVLCEEVAEIREQLGEARGYRSIRKSAQHPHTDSAGRMAATHKPVPGARQPWVDTDNEHVYEG